MVVPFFATLVPMLWYVNRNVTTEQLPPHAEPAAWLVAGSVAGAVAVSTVVGVVFAQFRRRDVDDERTLPYRQRVLQPDSTACSIFLAFVGVIGLWAFVELTALVPWWLEAVLLVPLLTVYVLGLPFLLLGPIARHAHWAVVVGLVATVLWTSLLATVLADALQSGRIGETAR